MPLPTFKDPSLLLRALTHRSYINEHAGAGEDNERLEFLGDAVLGLVVCEQVYLRYPEYLEGEMTKIKSSVVSRQTCAVIARGLGLDRILLLGKGMQGTSDLPTSLAAAALESVVGALFLEGGYAAAADFLRPLVGPLIEEAASSGHQQNYKSLLQQHAQQTLDATPVYRILDEKGPDHAKCFRIAVEISGRSFEPAWGNSKKKAEQVAALLALRSLGVLAVEAPPACVDESGTGDAASIRSRSC